MFENITLFVTASEPDGILGSYLFRHISTSYAIRNSCCRVAGLGKSLHNIVQYLPPEPLWLYHFRNWS